MNKLDNTINCECDITQKRKDITAWVTEDICQYNIVGKVKDDIVLKMITNYANNTNIKLE